MWTGTDDGDVAGRGGEAVSESFGEVMEELRKRSGLSRYRLAVETPCDPSYLVRIAHGNRDAPRLSIVSGIARALHLNLSDRNRLLLAAGYAPVELGLLGWPSALQSVADVLSDPVLSVEERDRFSDVVKSIADRWRPRAEVQGRAMNGAAHAEVTP